MPMSNSYIEKFNILQTLETNDYQNIFMGSGKNNIDDIVVINILNRSGIDSKAKLTKVLDTLVHLEKLDEDFVIVTKMHDGVPLHVYLEKEKPTIESRISMVFQYLKSIKKYDVLDYPTKSILINESQIVMEKGKLSLNELIIKRENFTEVNDFQTIIKRISKVAKKILFYPIEDEQRENYIPSQIVEFVNGLENNPKGYKSMKDIHDDFKNLYLYDESTIRRGQSKKKFGNIIATIIISVMILGTGIFACINILQNDVQLAVAEKETSSKLPTAYFKKIQMKNYWQFINESKVEGNDNEIKKSIWQVRKDSEIMNTSYEKDLIVDFKELELGEYDVALKVLDKNDKWSKEYVKKINITKEHELLNDTEYVETDVYEKLNDFNIFYENKENITSDYNNFRNGEYAIKFTNNQEGTRDISIMDLKLDKHSFLSMWIMADTTEDINIKIEGYKNGNKNFTKLIPYQPSKPNVWDLVTIDAKIEKIDQIKISMLNNKSTIWIDDLAFEVYK